MKLTPIKIKGKAGQKAVGRAQTPQSTRKRERSRDTDGDDGEKRPRHKRVKAKRPPALIEQLPTEILEHIAILSQNLNFPRSSLRIGRILSNKSFLTELVVGAFAPTWDLWFGRTVDSGYQSVHFREEDRDRIAGNPVFQSAVLACPWMNLALLLEAQRKWYRRHGALRLTVHVCTEYIPGDAITQIRGHPIDPGHLVLPSHYCQDPAACFEADWELFRMLVPRFFPPVWNLGGTVQASLKHVCYFTRYIELHIATKIPERLLRRPESWDDARWLFWLIRGGASLLPEHTWEMTKLGYEHIMRLADKDLALYLLLLFYNLGVLSSPHWPDFLLLEKEEEAYQEMGKHRPLHDAEGNLIPRMSAQHIWSLALTIITSALRPLVL